MNKLSLLCAGLWMTLGMQALALAPEATLPTGQEAIAREMFKDIRCVVCQSESIADSKAEVASDMRRHIRHELQTGKSADAIRDGLVARYGDQILMTPPLKETTFALWFGPLVIFLLAAMGVWRFFLARKG